MSQILFKDFTEICDIMITAPPESLSVRKYLVVGLIPGEENLKGCTLKTLIYATLIFVTLILRIEEKVEKAFAISIFVID